jgi:hypothetical protein
MSLRNNVSMDALLIDQPGHERIKFHFHQA